MEVREQRVRFVVAASQKEKSFLQLCQEFGISRPTGYAWLERYRQEGLEGIRERSRRPQRIPRQTRAHGRPVSPALSRLRRTQTAGHVAPRGRRAHPQYDS